MYIDKYNRQKAIEYANKWAFKRNPKYYNFDSLGGDCTNFVSQCIYVGSNKMNYTKLYGWCGEFCERWRSYPRRRVVLSCGPKVFNGHRWRRGRGGCLPMPPRQKRGAVQAACRSTL